MAFKITQDCEWCGKVRTMNLNESKENGGWRTLNNGSLEATLCNTCVREIINTALARKGSRDGMDVAGQ